MSQGRSRTNEISCQTECMPKVERENIMPIAMKKVGSAPHHDLLIADADDILVVLPEEGFKDTADASRVTVSALREYASRLGKKCGLVIVANNILAQEAESRRVYADG